MTRIKILTTGQTGASRAASATSVTRAGNIGATDVQAALEELDAEKQPLDSDLTAIAALSTQSFGRSLLTQASASAARTTLGVDYTTIAADTALTSRFRPLAYDAYGPETRPVYLDSYWRFFRGVGFTASVGTATTTVATQPSAGSATLVLADATGYVVGQSIVVARGTSQQQICLISAISTNTLTLHGRIAYAWAVGTSVGHVWANDTHPLDSSGYTALAYWLANLTVDKTPPTGTVLYASGEMNSTYTDANSEANVPVGWETFGSAGVSCLASLFGAVINPNARRGSGAYVAGTSSGDGIKTLTSIPVQPGQTINVAGIFKNTGGTPVVTVVDKNSTSTVLGTFTVGAATSLLEGLTNGSTGPGIIEFNVPAGVRDIEIRITQSTASAMQCYFDDVRVMVVNDRLASSTRYLLEDLSRPIVWLGDSWGVNLYSKLETQLETRASTTTPSVINAAVSGRKLDEMNARIATDVLTVLPYPKYCIVDFGMNDLSSSYSQATMETNIDTCINTLRAAGIKPIFLGIAPMTSQWSTSNDRNDQMRARVMLHTV